MGDRGAIQGLRLCEVKLQVQALKDISGMAVGEKKPAAERPGGARWRQLVLGRNQWGMSSEERVKMAAAHPGEKSAGKELRGACRGVETEQG